jgi:hypothetical protein
MLHARHVLDDCRFVLELLDEERDQRRFRILWVAACALLRAVGHVLEKVDTEESDNLEKAIGNSWKRWNDDRPANSIFWDFIREERNVVLKEYKCRYGEGHTGFLFPDQGSSEDMIESLTENVYKPMLYGPFASCDCRELVREGIQWWQRELDIIESA